MSETATAPLKPKAGLNGAPGVNHIGLEWVSKSFRMYRNPLDSPAISIGDQKGGFLRNLALTSPWVRIPEQLIVWPIHLYSPRRNLMLSRFAKASSLVLLLAVVAAAEITIPKGTAITVRLESAITSSTARSGQNFNANLVRDLVIKGKTVAKAGSQAKGKVVYAKSSGRLHDPGQLTLRLTSVGGIPVMTSSFRAKGKGHAKSNVTKIGGGAAGGALIGGLLGGGKGALIGAGAGAAAGTGVAAATGKEEAVLHAESAITFTTTAASHK
jgi:hypothetical protein